MTTRKLTTLLALTLGAAAVSLATPASALAAQMHTTTAKSPAICYYEQQGGSLSTVQIEICNSTVTELDDFVDTSFYGHIEFYGPHGVIASTLNMQHNSGDELSVYPDQATSSGDLWCAELWQLNSDGSYTSLDNNCVTD
jgi:hypothetical protein